LRGVGVSEASGDIETPLRVSTLELFFDLVFVFTITQLTAILVDRPGWRVLLAATLMLGVTWWMYSGYAWLTNAVPAHNLQRRLLLMAGMSGFLIMALGIPKAFGGGGGVAFGVGYLVVNLVHLIMFTRSGTQSVVTAMLRIGPFNLSSATLVLIAGAIGGTAEYWLWGVAFALQVVTPYVAGDEGFHIRPEHFVERHGLVVLIAFGESVVAIGIGAANLSIDAALVGITVLGLALIGCLWWAYFAVDDTRAEHALTATAPDRRPRVALIGYGYAHLVLLLGVVALAAGLKKAIGHAFEPASAPAAWYLGSGIALFLAGDLLFRRVLGIGQSGFRLAAAVLALLTVPLGLSTVVSAQLATLVAILVVALSAEHLANRPQWTTSGLVEAG
jgi:low temperature requirement protein LtrA